MRSDGKRRPKRWEKTLNRMRFALHGLAERVVTVVDGEHEYRFMCRNPRTLRRATTLFTKESGTIDWLSSTLRPADVFLDIGANIGLYTIFAAQRVQVPGHVYAVEPQAFNAAALFENIALNRLDARVTVLTMALANAPRYDDFFYQECSAGAAHSQLGVNNPLVQQQGHWAGRELKFAVSVDHLIEHGVMRHPNVVKIDVDGIEVGILQGMTKLLSSSRRPRSLQVEIHPAGRTEIESVLKAHGYVLDHCHFTMAGQKKIARGFTAHDCDYNAVFITGR